MKAVKSPSKIQFIRTKVYTTFKDKTTGKQISWSYFEISGEYKGQRQHGHYAIAAKLNRFGRKMQAEHNATFITFRYNIDGDNYILSI